MSIVNCPACSAATSDEYNFCTSCESQIKCLNPDCGRLLTAGKSICLFCGQQVPASNSTGAQRNTYSRRIKRRGKDFEDVVELSVSDSAVRHLAPLFGNIPNLSQPWHNTRESILFDDAPHTSRVVNAPKPDATSQLDFGHEISAPALPSPDATIPTVPATTLETISARYFEKDADILVASERDFKGRNWAEQQRNFIVLYADAYSAQFQKPVSGRDNIKMAADRINLPDPTNFTRYLTEAENKFLMKIGDGYKLNEMGKRHLKEVLSLMEGGGAPGYAYWNRVQTGPVKRHKLSNNDKARLDEWVKEPVNLGKLEIRSLNKAGEYALVAMWVLTCHLKKSDAVHWNEAYYYLTQKYQTVSATAEAFSYAVRNDDNHFRQNGEKFYLSSSGKELVDNMVNGLI